MKKLELKNYKVNVPYRKEDGTVDKKDIDYEVKDILVNILTSAPLKQDLKIGGREALLLDKLASKIENCNEEYILLESVDYEKLTRMVDAFHGWGKFDGELLRRVFEAETVEVQEKK